MPAQIGLRDVPVRDAAVAGQFRGLRHAYADFRHSLGDEAAIDDHMHAPKRPRLHFVLAAALGEAALDPNDNGGRFRAAQFRGQFRRDPAGQAGHMAQHVKCLPAPGQLSVIG